MARDSNQQVQAVFDRRSLSYDHLDWVRDDESLAGLADLAVPRPTDTFLDLATGTGAVAETIAASVTLAVGVDLSLGMLRTRRSKSGFAVQAMAERLPFSDDAFDLITCRNGLHHFCDPRAGIAEIRRVARPGGRIVISESLVPEGSIRHFWRSVMEIKDTARHPDMYFTADEFCGYLNKHGLPVHSIRVCRRPFSLANWLDNGCIEPERQDRIRKLLDGLTEARKRELHMSTKDGEVWLLRRTAIVLSGRPRSRTASA
jgi:ubiquinone/menaquinone biosynthesis C-methylase UbiE